MLNAVNKLNNHLGEISITEIITNIGQILYKYITNDMQRSRILNKSQMKYITFDYCVIQFLGAEKSANQINRVSEQEGCVKFPKISETLQQVIFLWVSRKRITETFLIFYKNWF